MSLVTKLSEVMKEIGHVPKRGTNAFHNYKYVMEADLCDAVREKLATRKVMMIPSVVSASREKVTLTNKRGETADSLISDVMVEYTLYDGESDEKIVFRMPGCGSDTGDKGVYKALTGSDKYAIMKAFLVPTGDDPEADAETDARAEGFRQAPPEERKALVETKLADLKSKMEGRKQEPPVSGKPYVSPGKKTKVIHGTLAAISAEKKTKTQKPYVAIEVHEGHKVHLMNIFDVAMFTAKEGEMPPLQAMFKKAVEVVATEDGKYLNFVSMRLEGDEVDPFALTDEQVPF